MKHLLRVALLLLCVSSVRAASDDAACMLVPLTLAARTAGASLVVEGRVTDQRSFQTPGGNIYTAQTVEVYKVFKGSPRTYWLTILTEGGTVGNRRAVLTATLTLQPGQSGVFFCRPQTWLTDGRYAQAYEVYGSLQGFIEYDYASNTAYDPFAVYRGIRRELYPTLTEYTGAFRTVRADPDVQAAEMPRLEPRPSAQPVITGFSPASVSAGTGATLTITGTGFGATRGTGFVEFRNGNNGGSTFIQPQAADYLSWSDTEIRVRVPSGGAGGLPGPAGTGTFRVTNSDPATATSPSPLTVLYAVSNVLSGGVISIPDHINDNGSGGYTWRMTTAFDANIPAKLAFARAMSSWVCASNMNWILGEPTATDAIGSDGTNVVRFSATLPAGVLGRCNSFYASCTTGTWYVTDLDVEFDDSPAQPWEFGPEAPTASEYDFESVAVHELGHAQQLQHIINPGRVMHFAIANGQQSRTLDATTDVAGGQFVRDRSVVANACGPGPMQAKACGSPLPVELVAFEGVWQEGRGVVLSWRTAAELNNAGFRVERSADGYTFREVGWVPARTGSGGHTYSFVDAEAPAPLAYYRLGQLDTDSEKPAYSSVVTVQRKLPGTLQATLAPNPASSRVVVRYTLAAPAPLRIQVLDAAGRVVATWADQPRQVAGSYEVPASVQQLAPGLYLVTVQAGPLRQTLRLLKHE